jgi:hypothetical protein
MKSSLVIAFALLVLVAGGFALSLFQGERAAPAKEAAAIPTSASPTAKTSDAMHADDEILARLDALAREVTDLQIELASLKAGAERAPVPQVASAERPESVGTTTEVDPIQRDAILKVIADDRAEQKRKQEEEQQQRDLASALARADRAAQKYGLTVDQRKGLVDVFLEDAQKTSDLRTQMQAQGFNADREVLRKAFSDLDAWRMDELTKRVGPAMAQQVHDGEFNGFPGGPGGGRRGNRGGPGAPGDGPNGGQRGGGQTGGF